MDPQSTMNVAVTEVGAIDAQGEMQSSADGELIRTWIVGALAAGNAASQADSRMLVWHDGLPRTQKRPKLGLLAGKTPDERAQAAEALAGRIGADVIIYGHLEPAGDAVAIRPGVLRRAAAAAGGKRDHRPLPARRAHLCAAEPG